MVEDRAAGADRAAERRRAEAEIRPWLLLLLLVMAHYGYMLVPYEWAAWATLQGVVGAGLLWRLRTAEGRRWMVVCTWGFLLQSEVAVCQATNLVHELFPENGTGLCDAATGLPLTAIGLLVCCWIALWLGDMTARRRD